MKRANAVLLFLLMIVSSLAGCIGGEEVDNSEYEDKIAELEEMLDAQNQTIAQREATIDGLEDGIVRCYADDSRPCRRNCNP